MDYFQHSFVDPKVEGTSFNSTSRAIAYKYIQERIEAHESIIRYYKRRHNALSDTCRMPPEVLACIFSQGYPDTRGDDSDFMGFSFVRWVRGVSHICSHWRNVALSTPSLWSTINVEYYPDWALEMLRRSKSVPLSVINVGSISKKTYHVLQQILASHLPRIQNLVVRCHLYGLGYGRPFINTNESRSLLQLLELHDATNLERLDIDSMGMENVDNAPLQLPDRIITHSASLKHLLLHGYGINWQLSPASGRSLKTLQMHHIPVHLQPSVAQILRFLVHVPLLETLSVAYVENNSEILSPHGVERVQMEHLKNVRFSCQSLPSVASFFECLTCAKDSNVIVAAGFRPPIDLDDLHSSALQKLMQKLDDMTDGSVLELKATSDKIQCWKSPPKRSTSSQETPVIELDFRVSSTSALRAAILRSLRLDRLVRLELVGFGDHWSLLGNLPCVEELKVRYCDEGAVIEALSHEVHTQRSKTDVQTGSHPAFPALTNLTIEGWKLNFWSHDSNDRITGRLLDCVKLRNEAGLRLKRLFIEGCPGVEDSDLDSLKEVIDVVDWDGFAGDTSEEEQEEEEEDEDFFYDPYDPHDYYGDDDYFYDYF
ncbi:hypothetical protein H0H92_006685 [Tricholoma furcatifolium]|nr:hypothetical protein H0H92_006685 [Tricholoma furcatifolium]